MRILFITNFYPPYTIGGMEHRCQEVVDELQRRAHEVLVLTSVYGQNENSSVEGHVHRVLHLEANMVQYRPSHFWLTRRSQEQANLQRLDEFIRSFSPDIVFVWGMWNLSRKIPAFLERLTSIKLVYSLASNWPAQPDLHTSYWQLPAQNRLMKPFKALFAKGALAILRREGAETSLNFDHVICVSKSLRDGLLKAKVPLKNIQVIYPGIDPRPFDRKPQFGEQSVDEKSTELLYAGALVPHKGVHTAVEALAHVIRRRPKLNVKLTILGSGHPDYEKHLRLMVERENLGHVIQFVPQIPRKAMPEFMRQFDVLVFPSIWEEPFSRVVLEAMASGLVVVGTKVGGTGEILIDGVNGLTFETKDADSLAGCIERLCDDPALWTTLANRARERVLKQYDIKQMHDEIEDYLIRLFSSSSAGTPYHFHPQCDSYS